MKTEFRNRAFLPVMMPMMILLAMAVTVGLFAWILLYNTKDGALALAAVMATGILVAMALAASEDKLDARHKAGVGIALLVPILFGGALAATGGGVDDPQALNINREEIVLIPEINVTLHAENSNEFVEKSLTLPANVEAAIVFENQEAGVPHNVAVKLAGEGGTAPADLGDAIAASAISPGVDSSFVALELDPGAYWYWCQVHPNMNGVLTVAEGAEPAAA